MKQKKQKVGILGMLLGAFITLLGSMLAGKGDIRASEAVTSNKF